MQRLGVALVLTACGGADPASEEHAQKNESPPSLDEVHRALVVLHSRAVTDCFGGFGKGAPYAAKLTVGKGTILRAEVRPLGTKYGDLPTECLVGKLTGGDLAGTDRTELNVRFAVTSTECAIAACGADDPVCQSKRDVACSVVIDP